MTQSPATPLPSPKRRRRLREAAGLTQAQVADRVGVSRETVRSWESGRTTPHGREREAYAELLAEQEDEHASRHDPETVPAHAGTGTPVQRSQLALVPAGADALPSTDPGGPTETAPPTPSTSAPDRADAPAGTGPDAPQETQPKPQAEPLTPTQAFDMLYEFCAPALVRQTYLLTGRRELARESVERAFQLAWQRWPEVAVDRDPAGWVRATAYEYALSPWHRLRPRFRHPEPPPADATDRALLAAILRLPPVHRRTLVLYDGVGLDLPDTAAETEASTPATANRLLHAREAVAARMPELSAPEELHRRLAALAGSERLHAPGPTAVRTGSERRARSWTRAAIAVTTLLVSATALTLATAPDHYEPPLSPGTTVRGVPPRAAPGTLSEDELDLRSKLRSETENGPGRLVPEGR
ncbi:helix-turn-helix domain-containing protein [Streptomyces sp. NPDC005907]|uniref:helix-turn-helix domain-containing protein n=1 Tax=Streptomyces sp. NPDC005907 TaxID=3154571 RepID=UPI0033C7125C